MDPLWHETLALAFAALFAAAGALKLRAFREWPQVLENYRLLPARLVRPVAVALPIAELSVALGLLAAPEPAVLPAAVLPAVVLPAAVLPAAVLAAVALLVLFALAIWVNLRRGRILIDCGCLGGRLRQPLAAWMVGRNLVLAGAALLLLVPSSGRALTLLDWVAAVGAALTLALLYPVLGIVLGRLPRAATADGVS